MKKQKKVDRLQHQNKRKKIKYKLMYVTVTEIVFVPTVSATTVD